jgi:type I restriction enzyme S subunit
MKKDVLTVHTGDIGVSAVIPESLDGSLGFATIVSRITNTDVILPEYLCAFLNYGGGKEQLYKYSRDARNNLNLTDFNKLIVPVPEIEVQRSIIDRMTRLLKLIEKRNQELLLLDELVKARFVELYNNSSLGEETTIESITKRVKVGFVGTCEKYYTDNSGIPMLRTGNITNNGIDLSDLRFVTQEFHEKNKKYRL